MSEPPQQPPYPQQPGGQGEPNQPPSEPYRPAPQPGWDRPAWQQGQQPAEQPGQQPGQQGQGNYGQQGAYPQPGGYGPQNEPSQHPYGPGGYQQQGSYPHQGGYPQQGGYQQGGGGAYPYGEPQGQAEPGFTFDLGARLRRRPEPRFGISLAAAGIGVAVVGVLVWSFGYLVQGIHLGSSGFEGGGRRFLGFGLSLVLVLLGYGLAITRRRGPLATAGAIAAALGVPLALTFLTFDLTGTSGGLPANTDLIYVLTVIVYLVSYLLVPGMRGRSFLLGLAGLLLASYVELKVASGSVTRASASIFGGGNLDSDDFGTGGLTAVALVFGLLYLAVAAYLDIRRMHGAATAMVVAGTYTILTGIGYGVLTFKQVGTGIELIVLGVALSWYGARFGRRFTTWFWMLALVVGFGLVVQKALPDSPAGAGITLIVIGVVVVVLAQVVATVTHESADIDEATADAAGDGGAHAGGRRH